MNTDPLSTSLQQELALFESITLEEMNRVRLMDRVETKFIFPSSLLPQMLSGLQMDYKLLWVEGNSAPTYRTAYFDTDSLFFYHEHHRRRNTRSKVRFRNYVESNLTFLEIKRKSNGRTNKKRIPVENEQLLLSEEEKQFLSRSGIEKKNLRKKLTNQYQRITLVSKKDKERVTFDINIRFQNERAEKELGNVVIMELKQSSLSRQTPIFRALREHQLRPFSVSKYCIGLIPTLGKENLKYNRFKKKLLKLEKMSQL